MVLNNEQERKITKHVIFENEYLSIKNSDSNFMVIIWKVNFQKVNRRQFKIEMFDNSFMCNVFPQLKIVFISMAVFYSEISIRN